MCDEINSSISPVSFTLIGTNPLPSIDPLLGVDHFRHEEIIVVVETPIHVLVLSLSYAQ